MCSSGATCLLADCCCSDLALYNPPKRVGLVQRGYHQNIIEMQLVLAMIWLKTVDMAFSNNHSSNHKQARVEI
jgi:hypothetical protein